MAPAPQPVPNHQLVVNRSTTDTQITVLCVCGDQVELPAYVPMRDESLAPIACSGCGRSYTVRTFVFMEMPRAEPTESPKPASPGPAEPPAG